MLWLSEIFPVGAVLSAMVLTRYSSHPICFQVANVTQFESIFLEPNVPDNFLLVVSTRAHFSPDPIGC